MFRVHALHTLPLASLLVALSGCGSSDDAVLDQEQDLREERDDLFVVDGKKAGNTFTYGVDEFLNTGYALVRAAGSAQTIAVNEEFNVQSNGEGVAHRHRRVRRRRLSEGLTSTART